MSVRIRAVPMKPLLALALALSSSALLPACATHAPTPPPPPPQLSREQALDRAFDFAQRHGYRRVSVRSAGRDGDAWDVHLRVERPFRGKLLVFLNAVTGEVLHADAFRDRVRRRERDDDEGEIDRRRGGDQEGRDDD